MEATLVATKKESPAPGSKSSIAGGQGWRQPTRLCKGSPCGRPNALHRPLSPGFPPSTGLARAGSSFSNLSRAPRRCGPEGRMGLARCTKPHNSPHTKPCTYHHVETKHPLYQPIHSKNTIIPIEAQNERLNHQVAQSLFTKYRKVLPELLPIRKPQQSILTAVFVKVFAMGAKTALSTLSIDFVIIQLSLVFNWYYCLRYSLCNLGLGEFNSQPIETSHNTLTL